MGRPPVIPAEEKTRIVLSVLAGEMTIAEAARREKVSEQSIGRWKAEFLEAGKTALGSRQVRSLDPGAAARGRGRGPDPGAGRGRGRAAGVEEVRGGPVGPFEDLEVIRVEAGMSTARFCQLIGMPERTWRRWQAKARAGGQPKGPWPRPARDDAPRRCASSTRWRIRRGGTARSGRWSATTATSCPRPRCCGCCATKG